MTQIIKIRMVLAAAALALTTVSALLPPQSGATRHIPGLASSMEAPEAEVTPLSSLKQVKTPDRHLAMRWAISQDSKGYCSPGGNSGTRTRSCYDCSGLVGTAYRRLGGYSWLQGGTDNFFALVNKGKLIKTSYPRWGDIVLRNGHTELFGHWTNKARTRYVTFGAHTNKAPHAKQVGYSPKTTSQGFRFYRVKGAG